MPSRASVVIPSSAAGGVWPGSTWTVTLALAGVCRASAGEGGLESAARGGVDESAAKLGDVLAGVDRNAEALRWYVFAAERGHPGAMEVAAEWFRDGTAGTPDPVQAVRWFLAPLTVGRGEGVHEAIGVARSMSAEDIRRAAQLAGRPSEGEALIAMRAIS